MTRYRNLLGASLVILAFLIAGCDDGNGDDGDTGIDVSEEPDVTVDPAGDMGPDVPDVVEDGDVEDATGDGVEVPPDCPVALATITEGTEVEAMTRLHLVADTSDPTITDREWSVVQPPGSVEKIDISGSVTEPTFDVSVVGDYTFSLTVTDDEGVESCEPWTATVSVLPLAGIHLELLWSTPGDPDESDEGPEAGADLDLHFIHPFATGLDVDGDTVPDGSFDNPFDCFWFNPYPDWGSHDPMVNDDPHLAREDTDGAGPEVMTLAIPEDGSTYRVAVHYWNEHGWGPSFATLRVFILGVLVDEITDVELVGLDFWWAVTIDWPSGIVTRLDDGSGGPWIIPDYEHPLFIGD